MNYIIEYQRCFSWHTNGDHLLEQTVKKMEKSNTEGIVAIIPFDQDPALSPEVKAFLKFQNNPPTPPIETIPPLEGRKVLENAQAGVNVDLSGIEEFEKT